MDSSTLLPIGTLLLGASLTAVGEWLRHRRDRDEAINDALRIDQTNACTDFLDAAHEAAHLLGRSAPGCPYPIVDRGEIFWRSESEVAKHYRRVELTCSPLVRAAARQVLESLRRFRESVDEGHTYWGEDYRIAYSEFSEAREDFISCARRTINPVADGADPNPR